MKQNIMSFRIHIFFLSSQDLLVSVDFLGGEFDVKRYLNLDGGAFNKQLATDVMLYAKWQKI